MLSPSTRKCMQMCALKKCVCPFYCKHVFLFLVCSCSWKLTSDHQNQNSGLSLKIVRFRIDCVVQNLLNHFNTSTVENFCSFKCT